MPEKLNYLIKGLIIRIIVTFVKKRLMRKEIEPPEFSVNPLETNLDGIYSGVRANTSRRDFLKVVVAGGLGVGLGEITRRVLSDVAKAGALEVGAESRNYPGITVESATLRTSFEEIPFDEVDPKFLGLEVVGCTRYSPDGEVCLAAPEKNVIANRIIFTDLPLNVALPMVVKDLGSDKFSLWVRGDIHEAGKDKCIVATVMTSEKWQNNIYEDNRRIYVGTKDDQWYLRVRTR